MRKVLSLLGLAVLLLGLMAVPALASPNVSDEPGPPASVPILLPAMGVPGLWAYGEEAWPEPNESLSVYEASGPEYAWDYEEGSNCEIPYQAIPANEDIVLCIGWIGSSYGQVMNVPKAMDTSFTVVSLDDEGNVNEAGPRWAYTPEQTAPYWTGPTAWNAWWASWFNYLWASPGFFTDENPFVLFNPRVNAGAYWNHLYFPAGPFPAGHYRMYWSMVQVRTVVDMTIYDPDSGPWPFMVWKLRDGFLTIIDAEYDFWVE